MCYTTKCSYYFFVKGLLFFVDVVVNVDVVVDVDVDVVLVVVVVITVNVVATMLAQHLHEDYPM